MLQFRPSVFSTELEFNRKPCFGYIRRSCYSVVVKVLVSNSCHLCFCSVNNFTAATRTYIVIIINSLYPHPVKFDGVI